DGRSPAGIFSLGSAFGYAPRGQAGEVKLPYVQAVATLECVDDPRSAHYNKSLIARASKIPIGKARSGCGAMMINTAGACSLITMRKASPDAAFVFSCTSGKRPEREQPVAPR